MNRGEAAAPAGAIPVRRPPSHWRELALAGADPLFADALHVGRPNLPPTDAVLERIAGVLERTWLTNDGPLVQELEAAVAAALGVAHCVAMANGTAALELAVHALGLSGEVIVPSFTFLASAHCLERCGVRPVFCDVDPSTHTLDPERVEALIGPLTTGILGVHLWGRACAPEALAELARRHGLRLLFDAAHAFGCSHRGRMLGGFGDAEVLSFHATKVVTTFEGGAVLTGDAALAHRLRRLRNFGFGADGRPETWGTNAKLHEASAAMGLASLANLDRVVAVNRRNLQLYAERLAGLPGLALAPAPPGERHSCHFVVVEVDPGAAGLTRDELVAALWAENVLARRYFHPGCHRAPTYASRSHPPLPVTERLVESVLCLPTGFAVGVEAIEAISGVLRAALASPGEVRSALRRSPAAWPFPGERPGEGELDRGSRARAS